MRVGAPWYQALWELAEPVTGLRSCCRLPAADTAPLVCAVRGSRPSGTSVLRLIKLSRPLQHTVLETGSPVEEAGETCHSAGCGRMVLSEMWQAAG